jgi:plastocyanin
MRRLLSALAVLILLVPVAPAASKGKVHNVEASGGPASYLFTWDPDELTIPKGHKVVWANPTNVLHHVTFYEGMEQSMHLESGKKVKTRFKKAGTYLYRCDVPYHSELIGGECFGMCGSVTVE